MLRRVAIFILFALCGGMAVAANAQGLEEWCAENGEEYPLHCAAGYGDVAKIKRLVESGADVNRKDKDGVVPLIWAARQGHANAITVLIKAGANVNQRKNDSGFPLYSAAFAGHVSAITALIEAGADVNQAVKDGATPLHTAAWHGYAKAIVALAEAGADVNRAGKDGLTPLHSATEAGHAKAIAVLAEAGADVNQTNEYGYTPLHWAAGEGHAKVITALVKVGAYLDATADDGRTPLDIARRYKKWSAVAALEKYEEKPAAGGGGAEDVFAKAWGFVVVIKTESREGSGVIVRPDMVATNCHVVEDDALIRVYKGNAKGRKISAEFRSVAEVFRHQGDLCLLRADGLGGTAVKMRGTRQVSIGEEVYAIGAPQGLEYTLSRGVVSAKREDDYGSAYIQTDAAISPGSSGGGLFDGNGNLVGVTTFQRKGGENLNFAISADRITDLLNR